MAVNEIQVVFNEQDFRNMVAGRVVTKHWGVVKIKVALEDIGFAVMALALSAAIKDLESVANIPKT